MFSAPFTCCPSLDILQGLHILSKVGGPELNSGVVAPVVTIGRCSLPYTYWLDNWQRTAATGLLGHQEVCHLLSTLSDSCRPTPSGPLPLGIFPVTLPLACITVSTWCHPDTGFVEHLADGLPQHICFACLCPSAEPFYPPLSWIHTPLILMSSLNLLMVDSISSSKTILNRTGPNTNPWGKALVTIHYLSAAPFTSTPHLQPCKQFLTSTC